MAKIIGLSTAVPHRFGQAESAEFAKSYCCQTEKEQKVLEKLYAHAAIDRRSSSLNLQAESSGPTNENNGLSSNFYPLRISSSDMGPTTLERMKAYERHASQLARESTVGALQDAQVQPDEITHLVTVSCTGFGAPGVDIELILDLGMNRSVQRTNVGFMGCHGAVNGLRAASAIAASQPTSTVLLCATELCSLHFQYGWSSNAVVANSLFSDGSAAAVLRNDSFETSERQRCLRLEACATYLIPNTLDAMQWHIGNHGFTMHLSPSVPSIVGESLRDWMVNWLAEQSLSICDIGGWAIHPGGPRLLSAVQEALALSQQHMAPSFSVLREFGNMSSPTILFILDALLNASTPRPYVVLAFGPGLTIEAALLI